MWSERLRHTLLSCGLTDLATYSLIGEPALTELFAQEGRAVQLTPELLSTLVPNPQGVRDHGAGFGLLRLTNPLTPDQELLRPSLLPGLVQTLRTNIRHTTENLAFFELTHCFFPRPADLPYERLTLGITLAGLREPRTWHAAPAEVDFYDLKGIVEELLDRSGVTGYGFARTHHPVLHPGRAAEVQVSGGHVLGYLGEIHPALASVLDVGERRCYVLEFDAELLISLCTSDRAARPISRFPVVKRDIAVVVPDSVDAATVVATIEEAGGDLLEEVRVFDVYHGAPVPAGHTSIACALTLQADDRTLSDQEADVVFSRIREKLTEAVGGQVREG